MRSVKTEILTAIIRRMGRINLERGICGQSLKEIPGEGCVTFYDGSSYMYIDLFSPNVYKQPLQAKEKGGDSAIIYSF